MSSIEKPIGIFDSGIGGLTVLKEIIKELPGESTIYLGDTARVPYGIRSAETVMRYSLENAKILMSKDIKLLVVACNTSSSISLQRLADELSVPVIGVVEPGARAAVHKSISKKIAVIGTETTIRSRSYENAMKSIDSSSEVIGVACPLFVPLVEEGWLEGDVVTLTAKKYLSPVKKHGVDSIVLGCTHYPMIKDIIASVAGVPLIDSAVETAREVHRVLRDMELLRLSADDPEREFLVTDSPDKFVDVGERFLEHSILNIKKIDILS